MSACDQPVPGAHHGRSWQTEHAGCITCSDEALPLRVQAIDAERGLALCEHADGARSSVETALVDPVAVGDVLLVHAGTAIAHAAAPEARA
jgi:hydrogenase assembly chaperone HypC/HupF